MHFINFQLSSNQVYNNVIAFVENISSYRKWWKTIGVTLGEGQGGTATLIFLSSHRSADYTKD